jgi:hypothetical protein
VTADPKIIPPGIGSSGSAAASASAPKSDENPPAVSRENYFASVAVPSSEPSSEPSPTTGGGGVWLLRVRALLFVTLCATFGVLLLILPWTPRWTDNPLLLASPALRNVVSSGFVRGFASGLGLLNLWLGFREAIFYHENPKSSG